MSIMRTARNGLAKINTFFPQDRRKMNDRREKLEQRIDGRSLRTRYSAMSTMLKAKHTDNTEIWHTSLRILFTTNYSSLRTGSKVV